ncbi:MAG: LamG domain-containing protein [Candidatus Brocadiae bacterium]|nr:LamG domain-containing protein [Candidatus Brocadiia bacterium]
MMKYLFLFVLSTSLLAAPTDGLVAYLNFDGSALDSSIYGNHGTALGEINYTQGIIGQSAYFDGIDDRIIIGNNGYNLAQGAIGAWVKCDSDLVNGAVFSQYSNDLNRLKLFAGNEARGFSGYGTTYFNLSYSTAENKQQFHYLLINYNFITQQHTFFIDGAAVATVTNSNAPQPGAVGQLTIGADKDFDNVGPYYLQSFFKGTIDELRIYNRNLTMQEVAELASVPEANTFILILFSVFTVLISRRIFMKHLISLFFLLMILMTNADAALVASWNFEEGSGTIVDKSGYGNNLTFASSPYDPSYSANTPLTGGNYSMYFDGDDYASRTVTSSLMPTTEYTLSTWVRMDALPSSYYTLLGSVISNTASGYQIVISGSWICMFHRGPSGQDNALTVATTLEAGKWYHIAGTYKAEGAGARYNIYLNGNKIGTGTTANPISYSALTGSSLFYLGRHGNGAPLKGNMDSVQIYNNALTDAEVTSIASVPEPYSFFLMIIGWLIFFKRLKLTF